MISGNTDTELLLTLNSLVGNNALFDKILSGLANNPLIRGFPIFFSLVALWFSVDSRERRSRMLIGLLATCVATVVSVWLQYHITPHIRPFLDPALHLKIIGMTDNWGRLGSFPSDTATLYFSLAAVVLLENRLAGSLCFLWALVTVGIGRVAYGWHYPSDIVGSLVLGPGSVYLFNKIPYLERLFERALKLFEGRMYIVHALLFVFLADAYNLFASLQNIAKSFLAFTFGHL
jgi:membrane-associated phospholipid phosphatase